MRKIHSTDQLLTLGMALTTDKRAMERRVRGVFARKTSAKSVIALSLVLALVLGFAAFTTACQPGKNDAQQPGQVLGQQPEAKLTTRSPLYQMLDVPKHFTWNQDGFDNIFHYTADLDIVLPDVSSVPVATASIREFTEEDLVNVSSVLFGEDAVYSYPLNQTKEYISNRLRAQRAHLEALKAEQVPNVRYIDQTQEEVDYYEQILPDAPAAAEQAAMPLRMTKKLSPWFEDAEGFFGDITKDGYLFHLYAENDAASKDAYYGTRNYIYASMGNEGYCPYYGTVKLAPEGVDISQAQAERQAKALAAQLTDELQLCYSAAVHGNDVNDRKEGWACVFMRAINGFPTAFVSEDVNSDVGLDVPYAQEYETMTIIIDDHGLADFKWVNPMTVTSVEQKNAGLLSFQEIVKRLPYEFNLKHHSWVEDDIGMDFTITAVTFGLTRIGASGAGSFTYEPVWNFFYEWDTGAPDDQIALSQDDDFGCYPYMTTALTLSAIDGRQIDRNTGY